MALVEIFVGQGELPEARRTLEDAVELESAPALLHNQLGEVLALESQGRLAEAEEAAEEGRRRR